MIYEVHVRAFCVPKLKGAGDFRRVAQNLELCRYERERTNCENLTGTHAFLKELPARLRAKYRDGMLPAETDQWRENVIAYFGSGDGWRMEFHSEALAEPLARIRMLGRAILVLWEQS
jgi:hypothetical protein